MADTQSAQSIAYARAPFSTWLGIVCLFVLFGLIVLAVIGPSPRTSDYEEAREKKRMEKLKALQEETQKDLTTYAWIDKNKGVARIPIDRAMEMTVPDLAQKKPAPAGPIATPASTEAPAGKPAAPAAPATTSPAAATPPPAAHQQSDTMQATKPSAPAGSPAAQSAASPAPPATQQSSPAAASPAPANTP